MEMLLSRFVQGDTAVNCMYLLTDIFKGSYQHTQLSAQSKGTLKTPNPQSWGCRMVLPKLHFLAQHNPANI